MIKTLLAFIFMLSACAMGIKRPELIERKEQDKLWRPCQDFEASEPVGKLCNRVCIKRVNDKCESWKQNLKDFSKKEDFEFFRSSSFVFIDEDNL